MQQHVSLMMICNLHDDKDWHMPNNYKKAETYNSFPTSFMDNLNM